VRRDLRREGWIAVGLLAVATFVALATVGRLPAVDLPQHALLLREAFDPATSGLYEFRPLAPNAAFYAVAYLFHAGSANYMTAMQLTAALAAALLPVASGFVADASGRNPALGCFAALGMFALPAAWGFFALYLGVAGFATSLALSYRFARRPTPVRGWLLVAALLATYWAHMLAWLITLPVVAAILCVQLRPLRIRWLWPLALGASVTVGVNLLWRHGIEATELAKFRASFDEPGPGALARLKDLRINSAGFGTGDALRWPWLLLATLAVAAGVVAGVMAVRALRRAHAARLEVKRSVRLRSWARRLLIPGLALALAVAYLIMPLTTAGVFLVYPRFLVFIAVLIPLLLPRLARHKTALLGLAALVPALWLVMAARAEAHSYAETTRCIDTLVARARPGESLVNLIYRTKPPGYTSEVDMYLAAELLARKGGILSFDLADYGHGAVGFRPGVERKPLWPVASLFRFYRHAVHGREYTALFLLAPPFDPQQRFGSTPGIRVEQCGDMALIIDERVPPGSRPAVRYLPHQRQP